MNMHIVNIVMKVVGAVIVLLRRNNIALIVLVFMLSIAIYSLNIDSGEAAPAAKTQSAQRIVVIDPGHGGEDPGAVSEYSGVKEKDIALAIAQSVKELLEKQNYKVIMTRTEDRLEYAPGTTSETQMRSQDLNRRKKLIDESGADIAVSIHLNKFPQTKYKGAQVFFPHDSLESERLARSIQKSIKEIADPENNREALVRGKRNELPIILFRDLKVPTVVVECGFLSNQEEEARLITSEYQSKLALAIKDGICKYLEQKIN